MRGPVRSGRPLVTRSTPTARVTEGVSMEMAERAQSLALKIRKHKVSIETEEATKNAFVMPFIGTVLGYDVFDPNEVIPEFTADVGTKKGEKIDYAIVHNGQAQLLVEVKKV